MKVTEEAIKQAFMASYEDDNDKSQDEDAEKDERFSLFTMNEGDNRQT